MDPVFEEEFKKQQAELKRKEVVLKKVSQIIDKKKEIQREENLEKQRLHNIRIEERRMDVKLKIVQGGMKPEGFLIYLN